MERLGAFLAGLFMEDRVLPKETPANTRKTGSTMYRGKRVLILGLARQGMALARFFSKAGAEVTISDLADAKKLGADVAAAEALGARVHLGGHPPELLDACDLLCLSGGVPPQIPLVQEAIKRGIALSNDSIITLQQARALGLGPLVAITGSSGKTTTTTLTGEMLRQSGIRVHVGGNIGTPLIDRMESMQPGEPIVLELSSFQLELFPHASTGKRVSQEVSAAGYEGAVGFEGAEGEAFKSVDVAAILNVTPNHLDRHPSMAAYADAKFNLLRTLPDGATVVLSADDRVTAQLAAEVAGNETETQPELEHWALSRMIAEVAQQLRQKHVQVLTFGIGMPGTGEVAAGEVAGKDGGAAMNENANVRFDTTAPAITATLQGPQEGNLLVFNRKVICRRDEVRLRGEHNLSNLLAAALISGNAGATLAGITQVAQSFEGVRHRLEIVQESNGVTWVNDSIATSPERAVAGLRSFDPAANSIFLLAGGKDKNLPWDAFAEEVLQRVSFLIGFGHAGAMIVEKVRALAERTGQRMPGMAVVNRLDDAVELAARSARAGTVVLLSPGGTSYDAYRDFEARGEHFRELVTQHAGLSEPSEHGAD